MPPLPSIFSFDENTVLTLARGLDRRLLIPPDMVWYLYLRGISKLLRRRNEVKKRLRRNVFDQTVNKYFQIVHSEKKRRLTF